MTRIVPPWSFSNLFQLEQTFYSREQIVDPEGFDKIVVGAGTDRDDFAIGIVQSCHDQNRRALKGGILAQHPAQLEAVGWWHHEIQEKTFGEGGVSGLHGLGAIVYDNRLVPFHFEDFGNERRGSFVVLDHHDFDLGCFHVVLMFPAMLNNCFLKNMMNVIISARVWLFSCKYRTKDSAVAG